MTPSASHTANTPLFVLKMAGYAAMIFVGYFIVVAIDWPGALEEMHAERGFVGGALIFLALLLMSDTVSAWLKARRRPVRPAVQLDQSEPAAPAGPRAEAPAPLTPAPITVDSLLADGDALFADGRLDAAADAYEQALRLRTAQLADSPGDLERRRAVAMLLERLGDIRKALGEVTGALGLYRQSLPIAQSLVRAEPDNPVYRDELATTERRIVELETSPA